MLESYDSTIALISNGKPGCRSGLHIGRKDREHTFANIYFKLIFLITGWTVFTEKYKARGPDV